MLGRALWMIYTAERRKDTIIVMIGILGIEAREVKMGKKSFEER